MDLGGPRRVLLFARRNPCRHYPHRRDRRKRLLRRTASQSAVYLRADIALCDLPQHASPSAESRRQDEDRGGVVRSLSLCIWRKRAEAPHLASSGTGEARRNVGAANVPTSASSHTRAAFTNLCNISALQAPQALFTFVVTSPPKALQPGACLSCVIARTRWQRTRAAR